jgi:flagellar protein FlaJ
MAAISESMIEPSKIFSIIITTKEYTYLEREYTKLMNEINVYGYDLVSALRNTALNSPSKKLTDLLNGLATTINSGGDLTDFFNKRAQTLLFEYRIEREKNTKTAETFMDVYISIVIAAPMVLMLLLMMMKVSGLGIALGTSSITLMMVLGVSIINIAFISFLHLRKPAE